MLRPGWALLVASVWMALAAVGSAAVGSAAVGSAAVGSAAEDSTAGGWAEPASAAAPAEIEQGPPPPPDLPVTWENWLQPPYNRWGLQHLEQLVPVVPVNRGADPQAEFGPLGLDLRRFSFQGPDGRMRTFDETLAEEHVDALLLWQGGSLRIERYQNGQTADTRHAMLTATSAITGLLAEMLIAEKRVDDMRLVTFYLPELKGSAWGNASVREVMDMEVGLDFREIHGDPWSEASQLLYAAGMVAPPEGLRVSSSINEYLRKVRVWGDAGMGYQPASANVEVLGWVMQRVTGKTVAQLFEERLFRQIGAEHDAYFVTDRAGATAASAGLGITARDLLRIGITLVQRGQYNGRQIVAPEVVAKIEAGGERRHAMPGNEQAPFYSYKSHWHIHQPSRSYSAWGIHGQYLFIAPEQQIVLVIQSSHPAAEGPFMAVAESFFQGLVDYAQRGF